MSNITHAVVVEAPAKTNLVLEIKGTDAEGYHELSTIFQALSLSDELIITQAEDDKLEMIDMVNAGFPVTIDSNNLVIKAQRLLEEHCGRQLPCHIRLIKNIPAGGGLGGGSADAAATLLGLNALYELQLSNDELMQLGAKLGADVCFGLVRGTAWGQGRGEKLTPMSTALRLYSVILVVPARGLSTPKVYAKWDKLPDEERHPAYNRTKKFLELSRKKAAPESYINCLSNDLEVAAFKLYPELAQIKQQLLDNGCLAAIMCGSGSTVMGVLDPQLPSHEVEALQAKMSAWGKIIVTSIRSDRQ